MSTENVNSKLLPAVAFCSLFAKIGRNFPLGEANSVGKNICALMPTASLLPMLANVTVSGTFLSPGPTSILVVEVPK
ncbi:MAG: hypothetical protein COB03_17955 [Alteromonas sp.]|nr:MAG: hypothetical protein COB03_17955 [Alteromonas sp.]